MSDDAPSFELACPGCGVRKQLKFTRPQLVNEGLETEQERDAQECYKEARRLAVEHWACFVVKPA